MNDNQKLVVMIAAGAIVAMLAFPPFYLRLAKGTVINLGYGFIFTPPTWGSYPMTYTGIVNIELLLAEWFAVILIAGIFWWIVKDKSLSR